MEWNQKNLKNAVHMHQIQTHWNNNNNNNRDWSASAWNLDKFSTPTQSEVAGLQSTVSHSTWPVTYEVMEVIVYIWLNEKLAHFHMVTGNLCLDALLQALLQYVAVQIVVVAMRSLSYNTQKSYCLIKAAHSHRSQSVWRRTTTVRTEKSIIYWCLWAPNFDPA